MTGTARPLEERTTVGGVDALVRPTPAFRLGITDLDVAGHLTTPPGVRAHQLDPVRIVLDEAMNRHEQRDAASSDSWLGPRLHAALRLSRREAGNRHLWNFLGLWGADYVRWRFGPPEGEDDVERAARAERFVGPDSKQALARLWWMSEIFRDGKDYGTAALALTNQDIVNNLFRMTVANHRPTALAALTVLERPDGDQGLLGGREANALAKATNAAASTLLLDVIGPDEPPDITARQQWENVRDDHDPRAHFDSMPEGPDDGEVPTDSVQAMTSLLTLLLAEARVRGKAAS